jgi:hypothetical protein
MIEAIQVAKAAAYKARTAAETARAAAIASNDMAERASVATATCGNDRLLKLAAELAYVNCLKGTPA